MAHGCSHTVLGICCSSPSPGVCGPRSELILDGRGYLAGVTENPCVGLLVHGSEIRDRLLSQQAIGDVKSSWLPQWTGSMGRIQ